MKPNKCCFFSAFFLASHAGVFLKTPAWEATFFRAVERMIDVSDMAEFTF